MKGGYDPERAALVLADALALGDKGAARKWGCCVATIGRYRARLKTDTQLRELVQEKKAAAEHDLATLRVRFLRKALATLEAKIDHPEATVHEIAGAVKIVGELHQVAMAVDDERPDSPDPQAESDEGGSGGEARAATH